MACLLSKAAFYNFVWRLQVGTDNCNAVAVTGSIFLFTGGEIFYEQDKIIMDSSKYRKDV